MSKLTHKSYLILVSEDDDTKNNLLDTLNKVYKEVKEVDRPIINVTVINAEHDIDIIKYKNHLDGILKDNKVQISIVINPSYLKLDMYLLHESIVTLNIKTVDSILYNNSGKYSDCKFDHVKYPPRELEI